MKKLFTKLAYAVIVLVMVALAIGFIYGLTYLGKYFSYEWFYDDMYVWSVCEHVKPEALKDPSICE
jgi:hypothetical protein